MASYFVSVAWPQGDTRRVNNHKETVNSLSADRIRLFKGKQLRLLNVTQKQAFFSCQRHDHLLCVNMHEIMLV